MSIVIIGDIHAKKGEPFRSTVKKFFNWLYENFSQDTIIQVGDLFDSSSPHAEVEEEVIGLLKRFKKVYILSGNHDYSRVHGNTLLPLIHHDNLTIITDIYEEVIDNISFLFLPYKYGDMKEKYEALTGEYAYIVTHTTPKQLAFGEEGIDYKLKGFYIHGHIHVTSRYDFRDDYGNQHFVLGVPFPTRYGEQRDFHVILALENEKKSNIITLPYFHSYETIKFGEEPQNKNNILNIIDAPDANSVYERYTGYYIREEGIELKRDNLEVDNTLLVFDRVTMKDKFKAFCMEQGVSQNILDCGLKYLEGL